MRYIKLDGRPPNWQNARNSGNLGETRPSFQARQPRGQDRDAVSRFKHILNSAASIFSAILKRCPILETETKLYFGGIFGGGLAFVTLISSTPRIATPLSSKTFVTSPKLMFGP
jgi:hypothetical protein